jgi:hypothetical protein
VQINKQHVELTSEKITDKTGLLNHCTVSPKGNILKCLFCHIYFMLYVTSAVKANVFIAFRDIYFLKSPTSMTGRE